MAQISQSTTLTSPARAATVAVVRKRYAVDATADDSVRWPTRSH